MTRALTAPLVAFVDALPVPQRFIAGERDGRLTVPIRAGGHSFHRDLPESRIWGYGGTVPGPTIEVERGQPVTVEWRNELDGPLPVVVTIAPEATDAGGVPVQCVPGLSGGMPDERVAALAGHTVVHLHGGLTPASYDGWAENLFAPGQHAVFHYPMDQRAALLWYHDHVMGVTKFDVYAGLAGLWIVRDERERELELPEGPPFELPLLIQDRNFDLDDQGRLTGRLVHKTDPDTMEAFAPFTIVNGKVWPVLEVQPRTYRFRVINGSNARTYRLVPLRDGAPDLDRIRQIGTDHGLLRTPARMPADGLVLAPAERADVLIDFSDLEPGSELTLLNTAAAPFDGSPFPAADAADAADLVSRPGCCTNWREDAPFGHNVPWLIGERGLPSMSTSSPPRVYTSCPHPTAQNGHTDSVTFMPAILASACSVVSDPALGPIPQSITRPMNGNCRSHSKDRGREPDTLIAYVLLVSIGIGTTGSLSPER